jgi:hypothetical protein
LAFTTSEHLGDPRNAILSSLYHIVNLLYTDSCGIIQGYTIVSTGSKDEMPKYMKLLNGFNIPYIVLLELDGKLESEDKNQKIIELLHNNKKVIIKTRLEDILGHPGHFNKKYDVKKFFENTSNITDDLTSVVKELFA